MSDDTNDINKDNVVELKQPPIISEAAPSVHNIPFIQVSRELIQKSKLPIESRMLLIYLISFKEGWKFYDSVIREDLGVGVLKLKTMFRDLRLAGYVKRIPIMGDNGRMIGSKRLFSAIPEFAKNPTESGDLTEGMENRLSVKPNVRKSTTKYINNNKYINDVNKKINKKDFSEEFDQFWAIYPKHADKEMARKRFDTLLREDYSNLESIMMGAESYARVCKERKTHKEYIKGPASWLYTKRFNDEYPTEEQLREESKSNKSSNGRQPTKFEARNKLLSDFKREALEEARRLFTEGGDIEP